MVFDLTWFLVCCCALSLLLGCRGVSLGMGPIGVGCQKHKETRPVSKQGKFKRTNVWDLVVSHSEAKDCNQLNNTCLTLPFLVGLGNIAEKRITIKCFISVLECATHVQGLSPQWRPWLRFRPAAICSVSPPSPLFPVLFTVHITKVF